MNTNRTCRPPLHQDNPPPPLQPRPRGGSSSKSLRRCRHSTVLSPTALSGSKMLICDFLQVNPDTIWQPSSRIILSQFSFQLLLVVHLIRPRTMRHVRLGKLIQLLALRAERQPVGSQKDGDASNEKLRRFMHQRNGCAHRWWLQKIRLCCTCKLYNFTFNWIN